MSKLERIIILVNLVLLLGYFNWSILAKENTLADGQFVLLELAPVDPRSLMQGDYMRLRYAIANIPNNRKDLSKRGYCIVKADSNGVAQLIRYQDKLYPLNENEQPIRYFSGKNRFDRISLGAGSFFFEEGTGKRYESAKFGGLKVDKEGNSILTGLYDEERKLIVEK